MLHDEPIYNKYNKIIGYTTSSNYSFCFKKNLCLAYIKNNAENFENLEIEIEGKRYPLNLEKKALFDPDSQILRS